MRIVGVIDLLGGRAVHARAGDRQKYAPVASVAGDPIQLARRYLDAGLTDLYVADLGAILSRTRHDALLGTLAGLGVPVWVDAGVTTVEGARECVAAGATHVIVGLETLSSFDALRAICEDVSRARVAFSLDLRNSQPLTGSSGALSLAKSAAEIAGAVIVLDLARVGTRTGVDMGLIRAIRESTPGTMLLAGGGIRHADDLMTLAALGCDGALLATAFHDGRIGAAEIQAGAQASVSR